MDEVPRSSAMGIPSAVFNLLSREVGGVKGALISRPPCQTPKLYSKGPKESAPGLLKVLENDAEFGDIYKLGLSEVRGDLWRLQPR